MTSLAQRTWSAFSAEDRAERRALGGITLKMYDEDEVPLDHALRHWSYREFPRDLGHISKIYNGEVIGSYLEAGGNPDATLYGGTYTMLGLYLEEHVNSLVKLLLEHGADPNHRADGRSPHEIRHHPRENYELEYSCPCDLKRFEEARSLLRKTMPVARRVLGESKQLTLMIRGNYARTLYFDTGATLDALREAVTTFEDMARIARRVFGGAHPLTESIEVVLRNARTVLRAREAGTRVVFVS